MPCSDKAEVEILLPEVAPLKIDPCSVSIEDQQILTIRMREIVVIE